MQLSGADLRLLRVFAAVVKHKGFVAAQVELNISQSTISNHITSLEQRMGMRLCQRGRTGFKLTDKGEQVYVAAIKLLQSLEDFSADASSLRRELAGKIRLGLVDAVVTDPNCRLSDAFAAFNQRTNAVVFEVAQSLPQSLQVKVLADELDCAVGSFPNHAQGLNFEFLYREEHSLYCARMHRLFQASHIDPEDVIREPTVGRSYWRNSHRHNKTFVNTKATAHGIEPQMVLVLSGGYIGFLPDHYASNWVKAGKLRQILPSHFQHAVDFHLITREGAKQNLIVSTFLADLRSSFRTSP
jgi:DNA-binding transcriptional LysR family regulator